MMPPDKIGEMGRAGGALLLKKEYFSFPFTVNL